MLNPVHKKKVRKYKLQKVFKEFESELIDVNKVVFFQKKLLQWYKNNGRKFRWREKGLSDYEYVVAEVLLQRTKAENVAKLYEKFILDFPSWEALVQENVSTISEYIKPLGLYTQRSIRLKNLAIEMMKRRGELPSEREDLETIPFMGQYIANAVELVIFNRPMPLLDVNMSRVLERFFQPRKLADIRYDPFLQELSYKVVQHKDSKRINWAILDFAATICTSRNPKCTKCGLNPLCTYFRKSNNA